jgi:ArsR family transcriptional regulator
MESIKVLKALADETRYNIFLLLLKQNCCVRELSRKLNLSESAVSQHIKILKEAGLLTGVKKGYFMHYEPDRQVLRELSLKMEELAATERVMCDPDTAGCRSSEGKICYRHRNEHQCHGHSEERC